MSNQAQPSFDIRGFLSRRKYYLLVPLVTITLGAIVVACLLPSVYRSEAVILIENQQVEKEYVRTGVPEVVEMTIENITQQVMSKDRLKDLILRHGLYPDLRKVSGEIPDSAIVKLRKNIELKMITTDVLNPRTGLPGLATIGFALAYTGAEPGKVHAVTTELTSLYLEQNSKNRTREAQSTAAFIEGELQVKGRQVQELEERVNAFRERHAAYLPEKVVVHREMAGLLGQEISRTETDIKKLKEQKALAQVKLNPDMQALTKLKTELAAKEGVLSPRHPDIIALKSSIQKMEKELQKGGSTTRDPVLEAQLRSLNAELKRLERQKAQTQAELETYLERIQKAAQIEGEYRLLLRDYENARTELRKLNERGAEVRALSLEAEETGQMFNLLEPAGYPNAPYGPKRMLIVLIGLGIALGAGLSAAVARELSDQSVWSEASLDEITGQKVLAVIPAVAADAPAGRGFDQGQALTERITYSRTRVVEVDEEVFRQNRLLSYFSGNYIADQYGVLKAKILERIRRDGLNTVLITSAMQGEGKSLTAANLALSLSKELTSTVLLLDADLRKPSLHEYFGLSPQAGLSDYLLNGTALEDLFISPGINKLVFLPGHARVEHSAEALGSPKMANLVREVKARYPDRFVIIDSPPLNGLADSLILSQYADGVIVVVEAGRTHRSQITDAIKALDGRNIIGFVLNRGALAHRYTAY